MVTELECPVLFCERDYVSLDIPTTKADEIPENVSVYAAPFMWPLHIQKLVILYTDFPGRGDPTVGKWTSRALSPRSHVQMFPIERNTQAFPNRAKHGKT